MREFTLRFVGFLSNCDDSILDVQFGNGYNVKKQGYQEAIQFISELTGKDQMDSAGIIMRYALGSSPTPPVYYIEKEVNIQTGETPQTGGASGDVVKLFSEGSNYFFNRLRLMRLFKEGNILMPISFGGLKSNPNKGPSMSIADSYLVSHELYHLDKADIPELMTFMESTFLPFKNEVLQMSFDLFELSYMVNNWSLMFLTSVMGIEALLNPDVNEVRHRVSRNLAILIGKDKEETSNIYKKMLNAYGKRSKISHGKGLKSVDEEAVREVRNLLRRAIKSYYKAGLEKDNLINKLNELGFDTIKPWA